MKRLVIFDCDGVLIADFDKKRYNGRFVSGFLAKHGSFGSVRGRTLREAVKRQNELWSRVDKRALTGKMSHREANEFWLESMGLGKRLVGEFLKEDKDFWRSSVRSKSSKQIRATLARLKSEGYALAVLSNDVRDARTKREILSWVGIDRYLDAVYTSHSIGHMKPDKASYLRIVRRFKAKPKETVFVGHQDYEIDGANRAGLVTVCIRDKPCPSADFQIRRFSSLPRILSFA